MITLQAESRDEKVSPQTLRKSGKIPAIYYGKKEAPTSISVSQGQFTKVWKQAGESSVVTIQNGGEEIDALIKDVQFDPVTGSVLHADFYVFEKGKALDIKVPIEFVGESPAVKNEGALLVKVLHELHISAQPKDLPHQLEADISVLAKLDDHILAQDIKLPNGVTLIENPEEVVALVSAPKEEVEEVVPPSLEDIELSVEKGKKEEDGEAPAAEEPKPKAKEEKK